MGSLQRMALAVPVILLLAGEALFAVKVLESDIKDFVVQRDMVYWGVEGRRPTTEAVDTDIMTIDQALALWPGHPDYLALKARLQAWRGQITANRVVANEHYRDAIATMRLSLEERPGNPYSWAQYAEYLATQRDTRAELLQAVAKVRALGAGEPKLQQRMQALMQAQKVP